MEDMLMEAKNDEVTSDGLFLSVSLNNQQRWNEKKMRNEHCIYRRKKCTKDEATPLLGTGPTNGRHVFGAINASWDEEFINWFSLFSRPKMVIRQDSIKPSVYNRRNYGVGGNWYGNKKRVNQRPHRVTATVLADGNVPSAKLPSVRCWPWKALKSSRKVTFLRGWRLQ